MLFGRFNQRARCLGLGATDGRGNPLIECSLEIDLTGGKRGFCVAAGDLRTLCRLRLERGDVSCVFFLLVLGGAELRREVGSEAVLEPFGVV